jgi:Leucine-rich repeat (LRR) protein
MTASKKVMLWMIVSTMSMLTETNVFGQARFVKNPSSIPVYRSESDSLKLKLLEQELIKLENTTPFNALKVDSVLALQWRLTQEGIIGYRRIYTPDREHVSLDSLGKVKDLLQIKKVTIYDYDDDAFPEIVLRCKNLESLELLNTNFRKLPQALDALGNLRTVSILNHQSKRPLKLERNTHITTLTIRADNPKAIPSSFRRWGELVTLDLSENFLTRFPQGARFNKKLKELNLQENLLTLKKRLKPHPYLEKLAMQHNQVNRVPSSIGNFRNLRKLNFNYNKITDVHAGVARLTKLEHLSFYHNQLTRVPPGAYEITSLKEIDLFYNQIELIEPQWARWKNLTMLYLSHNKILSLPENIHELSSLYGLYIWDNRIERLPDNIGKIKTLRSIWANNNYLKNLPSSILDLQLLEELDISHNYITEIPEAIFDYQRLKILSLVNNPWDKKTMDFIPRRAWELRAKNVFVHISDNDPTN